MSSRGAGSRSQFLPYLEQPPPIASASRRVNQLANRTKRVIQTANQVIVALNALNSATLPLCDDNFNSVSIRPLPTSPSLQNPASQHTAKQDRLLSNIFNASKRFHSRPDESVSTAVFPSQQHQCISINNMRPTWASTMC